MPADEVRGQRAGVVGVAAPTQEGVDVVADARRGLARVLAVGVQVVRCAAHHGDSSIVQEESFYATVSR